MKMMEGKKEKEGGKIELRLYAPFDFPMAVIPLPHTPKWQTCCGKFAPTHHIPVQVSSSTCY